VPGASFASDGTGLGTGAPPPGLERGGNVNGLKYKRPPVASILDNRHSIPSENALDLALQEPFPAEKTTLSDLLRISEAEVFTNARMKLDPQTGECISICVASRPIFKADDFLEAREKQGKGPSLGETDGKLRAARRAKSRLYDLCRFNTFTHFITLTLDDSKVDGYDYKAAVRKLCEWCDNRVRRKGFKYVIVPEKHPTSGRIHFHGLVDGTWLKMVNSGHRDGAGRTIYNITDWGYGFTTAVKLDGTYEAVCHYIAKYMTKSEVQMAQGTLAGRYYYHSHNLEEPRYIYFNALSTDELGEEVKVIQIDGAGLTLRYFNPLKTAIERKQTFVE